MAGVKRIVFAGNSLTDGSAWCDWVIETLQANGYPDLILFNAGVAGDDTPRLKRRYDNPFRRSRGPRGVVRSTSFAAVR